MTSLKAVVTGALVAGLLLLSVQATAAQPTMNPESGRPPASDFVLGSTAGDDYRLQDLRGQWVLVSFWATWCSPCLKEMPTMERLYQAMAGEGLEILAVHAGPGGDSVDAFLEQVPVSFPVLLDEDLGLGGWDVIALPTAVLVDPSGRRVYRAVGPREWDSPAMKAFLRDLMATPMPADAAPLPGLPGAGQPGAQPFTGNAAALTVPSGLHGRRGLRSRCHTAQCKTPVKVGLSRLA